MVALREPEVRRAARLVYLDNLKLALTVGVIVAHAAMTYGAVGTWVYEEPSLSGVAEGVLSAFVSLGALFGLGLFFLLAGMLTPAPLLRRGPRGFFASRLWRLGTPLVAYALVVWPVLQWLRDRALGRSQSLAELYRFEFGGTRWTSLGTGPLWFVAVLLVVTSGWTLWRWAKPVGANVESGPLALRHLVSAAAVIAAATFVVRVWFPVDSGQFLDLHVWLWPQAAALFAFGAIGTERGWSASLPRALARHCRLAAIIAVVALVALVALSDGTEPLKGGWRWEPAVFASVEGTFSVSVSLLVLDRFRRRHAEQGHLTRRLAHYSYGAFVAQGPVLVCVALALRPLDVSGDLKFALLAVAGVTGSFALSAVGATASRATRSSPRTRNHRS